MNIEQIVDQIVKNIKNGNEVKMSITEALQTIDSGTLYTMYAKANLDEQTYMFDSFEGGCPTTLGLLIFDVVYKAVELKVNERL